MDLKKMIYAPKPNQSKTVTPKQQRLELIKNLIEEEQNRIRRLIVQMSNYNDEVVLQAFKSEINQDSTNLKSLTEERNKLEEELIHLSLTIDQREQIMEFASKIQQRIEDASFEEKCCIMDILDVQVVIHNDNQGKW